MRVTVRILSETTLDGETFAPDDVIELPSALAMTLVVGGRADPHPSAVTHACETLGKPIRHLHPADLAAGYQETAPKTPRRKKAAE